MRSKGNFLFSGGPACDELSRVEGRAAATATAPTDPQPLVPAPAVRCSHAHPPTDSSIPASPHVDTIPPPRAADQTRHWTCSNLPPTSFFHPLTRSQKTAGP